ncbi:MAG TPA: hypothetical protein VLC46_12580 [Thermoanaerobaculia bacterium]|jgi:hypothetical protein|nr:hypothetical protein [Thermoanaerobaculia bacterium]
MDANRLIKWVVIIMLAVVVWKYGIPWAKQQLKGHSSSVASSDNSCVTAAQRASETWGSGLHRFANPPYDIGAWSSFHDDVAGKISSAESECRGPEQSCEAARTAMSELRNLVGDLDTAIRNGSPPPDDAVQRQEAIDTKIEAAAELTRSGK